MDEVWKDIIGYEGLYQISSNGNVMSFHKGEKLLTPKQNCDGYLWYALYKNGASKPFLAHRLVALHFIENPQRYPFINHMDFNRTNNNVSNLEWCTAKYNSLYSRERIAAAAKLRTHEKIMRSPYKRTEKIDQLDLNGMPLTNWDNVVQVQRNLHYSTYSVYQCCLGKRKTAYGFKWAFAHKNTPLEKTV